MERIPNPGVAGSSPAGGAKFFSNLLGIKILSEDIFIALKTIFFVKNLKGKGP